MSEAFWENKDFLPEWALSQRGETTTEPTQLVLPPSSEDSRMTAIKTRGGLPSFESDVLTDESNPFVTSDPAVEMTTIEELAAIAAISVLVAQEGTAAYESRQIPGETTTKQVIAREYLQLSPKHRTHTVHGSHKHGAQKIPTGNAHRLRYRRNLRSRAGCWTCRLRHKACPEDGQPCGTCKRLNIPCDYATQRPAYMGDQKLAASRLRFIKGACRRRRARRGHR